MGNRTKTDNELRGDLIAAGAMEQVHDLEERLSRDASRDRAEYRAELERMCAARGISRLAPIGNAPSVLPYGPAV